MMYTIVRKFYANAKAMEEGKALRVFEHGFDPMTLEEARTVVRKLCPPKYAIDHIVPLGEKFLLKECPFCGLVNDSADTDVVYPDGTYWATHEEGFRYYFSRNSCGAFPHKPEGMVFNVVCPCGVRVTGDSLKEAIEKWQRRVN